MCSALQCIARSDYCMTLYGMMVVDPAVRKYQKHIEEHNKDPNLRKGLVLDGFVHEYF